MGISEIGPLEIYTSSQSGSGHLGLFIMASFKLILITVMLKMVFSAINSQYKKNVKETHDKASSPGQDFMQIFCYFYLIITQYSDPGYVPRKVVALALESKTLDEDLVTPKQFLVALQSLEPTENSWRESNEPSSKHVKWVFDYYSIVEPK